MNKDMGHLFLRCDLFGRLWSLVANWLGLEIVSHSFLYEHLVYFGALGGYSKRDRLTLNKISH
jgi:hypothetical protein